MDNYITHIEIEGLFGEKDIRFSPDPKVNILAGINGSGKSTLLRCMHLYINFSLKEFKESDRILNFIQYRRGDFDDDYLKKGVSKNMYNPLLFEKIKSLSVYFDKGGICDISLLTTFELLLENIENETSNKTQLDFLLNQLIYGNNYNNSCYIKVESKLLKQATTYYRKGENEKGDLVLKPIDDLLQTINDFLVDSTKKIVSVDDSERRLQIVNHQKEIIEFEQLSTGEKQLLIILFTVFLQEKESTIFLLDEPEITLHIKWQENLIEAIFKINPNIQLFIATHASSIFFNGYQDKLILMEDITFPTKAKENVG